MFSQSKDKKSKKKANDFLKLAEKPKWEKLFAYSQTFNAQAILKFFLKTRFFL